MLINPKSTAKTPNLSITPVAGFNRDARTFSKALVAFDCSNNGEQQLREQGLLPTVKI